MTKQKIAHIHNGASRLVLAQMMRVLDDGPISKTGLIRRIQEETGAARQWIKRVVEGAIAGSFVAVV